MEPPPPPLQLLSLSSSSSSSPSSSSPSPSPSSSSLSSSSSSVSSSQLLPFACRLCSLSFAKSHSLAEHVMCRHSTTKEEEEEENEDKDSSSSSPPPSFSSSSASTSSAAASSASNSSSPSSSSPVSSSSAKRSFKCARCEVVAATKSDLHRHENDSHRLQQTERFLWAMYSEQRSRQQSTNNNSRVMPDDNVEGGEEFVEELLTEEKSPNRVLDPFLLSTAYRCSLCGQAFTYRCRWHLVHRDELPNDDDADDDNSLKVNKKGPTETTQLPFPCFFCIKKIFEAKKRRAAEIKRQQQLRNSKTNSEQPVIELDEDEEEMEAEEMEIAGDNEPISRADHPLGQNSEIPKGDNKKDDNQNNRTASVPNRTSATTPPLTITAKLTYKCAGCRLRFTSREDRADHEAAEGHRPSKFACSICGRVLRDRYKLDRHRATVHADLPQHLLQMSFGDLKSANSEHLGPIRTPSAVGAFQCPLCRKRLSRKDHLKEHLRKRHSWRGSISNSAISLAAAKAAERKVQDDKDLQKRKMEVSDNHLGDKKEEKKATTDQNSETNHHVHLRLEIEANGFISSSTNKFSSSASSSSSSSSGVSSGSSSCNCSPTIIY